MRRVPQRGLEASQQLAAGQRLHGWRPGHHRGEEGHAELDRGHTGEVQEAGLSHRLEESLGPAEESAGQDYAGEFRGLGQQEAQRRSRQVRQHRP